MITKTNFLKHTLNLIKKGWTQGNYAVNQEGVVIGYTSGNACKFCLSGALARTQNDFNLSWYNYLSHNVRQLIENNLPDGDVISWNDKKGRTKKQVVSLLNKVIKSLSRKG